MDRDGYNKLMANAGFGAEVRDEEWDAFDALPLASKIEYIHILVDMYVQRTAPECTCKCECDGCDNVRNG